MTTPHKLLNPDSLAPAKGFSHVVIPARGRTIWFGGMAPQDHDGAIVGDSFLAQFDVALGNLATALREAGAEPAHLVWMQLFVSDRRAYRAAMKELGEVWRRHLGQHYPAMALFEVGGFYDEDAMCEVMAVAVVPEDDTLDPDD
ncbi:MAG: Rid family hydrolase [Planctomycetota bacterium]